MSAAVQWVLTFDGYPQVWLCTVDVNEHAEDDRHCDLCSTEDASHKGSKLFTLLVVGLAATFVGIVECGGRGPSETVVDYIADTFDDKV
jgi:hypothetical protein